MKRRRSTRLRHPPEVGWERTLLTMKADRKFSPAEQKRLVTALQKSATSTASSRRTVLSTLSSNENLEWKWQHEATMTARALERLTGRPVDMNRLSPEADNPVQGEPEDEQEETTTPYVMEPGDLIAFRLSVGPGIPGVPTDVVANPRYVAEVHAVFPQKGTVYLSLRLPVPGTPINLPVRRLLMLQKVGSITYEAPERQDYCSLLIAEPHLPSGQRQLNCCQVFDDDCGQVCEQVVRNPDTDKDERWRLRKVRKHTIVTRVLSDYGNPSLPYDQQQTEDAMANRWMFVVQEMPSGLHVGGKKRKLTGKNGLLPWSRRLTSTEMRDVFPWRGSQEANVQIGRVSHTSTLTRDSKALRKRHESKQPIVEEKWAFLVAVPPSHRNVNAYMEQRVPSGVLFRPLTAEERTKVSNRLRQPEWFYGMKIDRLDSERDEHAVERKGRRYVPYELTTDVYLLDMTDPHNLRQLLGLNSKGEPSKHASRWLTRDTDRLALQAMTGYGLTEVPDTLLFFRYASERPHTASYVVRQPYLSRYAWDHTRRMDRAKQNDMESEPDPHPPTYDEEAGGGYGKGPPRGQFGGPGKGKSSYNAATREPGKKPWDELRILVNAFVSKEQQDALEPVPHQVARALCDRLTKRLFVDGWWINYNESVYGLERYPGHIMLCEPYRHVTWRSLQPFGWRRVESLTLDEREPSTPSSSSSSSDDRDNNSEDDDDHDHDGEDDDDELQQDVELPMSSVPLHDLPTGLLGLPPSTPPLTSTPMSMLMGAQAGEFASDFSLGTH